MKANAILKVDDVNSNEIKKSLPNVNPLYVPKYNEDINSSEAAKVKTACQALNALTTNTFKGLDLEITADITEFTEPFTYALNNRNLTFEELESAWAKDYIDNEGITGLNTDTLITVGAANIGDSTTLIFSDGTNTQTKTVNSKSLAISIYAGTGSGSETWLSVTKGDLALILASNDKQAAFANCLNSKNVAGYTYTWDSNDFKIYTASSRIKFSIDLSASTILGKTLYDAYKTNTPSGLTVTELSGSYGFAIDITKE